METFNEPKGKGLELFDEAVEKIGAAVQEKAVPVAEKVADKVVDATGGRPDEKG